MSRRRPFWKGRRVFPQPPSREVLVRRFLVFAIASLALLTTSSAGAQQREITGTVTVTGTGQPLTDAIVGVVGSAGGARTNERGEYRLRAPNGDVTIQVRAIGYKRQTQRVAGSASSANFSMEKDVLQLEGVTVTGAATTIDRKNAATAISAVSSQELARVPAVSIENALQGKTVGVSFNMNNGAPGWWRAGADSRRLFVAGQYPAAVRG